MNDEIFLEMNLVTCKQRNQILGLFADGLNQLAKKTLMQYGGVRFKA